MINTMKNLLICAIFLFLSLPVRALSPAPQPEPAIPIERALELAKQHALDKKIDLSHHYIDRVWIGYQKGKPDRRWIISWSPKPEEAQGWIILKVKDDGTVTDEKGGTPWIDPRMLQDSSNEQPPKSGSPPDK